MTGKAFTDVQLGAQLLNRVPWAQGRVDDEIHGGKKQGAAIENDRFLQEEKLNAATTNAGEPCRIARLFKTGI